MSIPHPGRKIQRSMPRRIFSGSFPLALAAFLLVSPLYAQVPVAPLPRIGDDIDVAAIGYFGLFPEISEPSGATVSRNDTVMTFSVGTHDGVKRISLTACEAAVLAIFLDAYERMGEGGQSMKVLGNELQDPSLQRCFASLMQKHVLRFPVRTENKGEQQGFVLRDGSTVRGIPLALTDRRIALWTGDGRYDHRRIDSSLTILSLSEIDSIRGTYFSSSAEHGWLGWLVTTAALTSGISMLQRDPWSGRGGSGSLTFILPTALVTSGILSIIPGLITASVLGEERASNSVTNSNREEVLSEVREKIMTDYPPPEVLDRLGRTPRPEIPRDTELTDDSAQGDTHLVSADGGQWDVPDIALGLEFLFNWYRVDSRPFAGLPAIVAGREFPLVRKQNAQPLLSLFPHLSLGPLHGAAGLRLQLHTGRFSRLYAGVDWVANWDDMGKYSESGMGWGSRERTRLLKDNLLQSAFFRIGCGFRLAGCDVSCELRMEMKPGLMVEREDWWYTEYENPDRSSRGPSAYGGLGLSMLIPLTF